MSKTTTMDVEIRFGDCDPAGIVFFPRFHHWMDAASLHFFMSCGVPPWRELEPVTGVIGTPLLENQARFVKSATYGERLTITTHVQEWRAKVFVQKHVLKRGDDLICEGTETRVFCVRDAHDRTRIRAIAVPPEIRSRCE